MRFPKVILHDRCRTSYDLASLFSWQAQYFRRMELEKKHKTHWYKVVGSALNFPFLKDVSQDCFAFEAVKFKSGGSLAVFRFEAVKVHFVRKSRRSALFWKCQFPLLTEVAQNCLLSGTNIDRSIHK